MKEQVLVLLKPDVTAKRLTGHILTKLYETELKLVAMKMVTVSETLAREHYRDLKSQPFFEEIVSYLQGKLHHGAPVVVLVYTGTNAITICRETAGATNPEDASLYTIRGAFGRITTTGIYENLVHVSANPEDAEREIKLWFSPQERESIENLSKSPKAEKRQKQKV